MIECPILVGGGGSTEQLGIYPIGTDGRPMGDVTVPYGVTSLYQYIFYQDTAITSVSLPNSVTSLGTSCFQSCTSLTSITIPINVTSLGSYCFQSCSKLTSITLPNSITSLGNYCSQSCTGLTSITLPNSITSLGSYCFNSCTGLTSITCNTTNCTFISSNFLNCSALTTFNTVSNFNPTGLNLSYSPLLTVDTMVSMFNNLATIVTTKTITLGATNLAKLTEGEKAIATGKRWTLA